SSSWCGRTDSGRVLVQYGRGRGVEGGEEVGAPGRGGACGREGGGLVAEGYQVGVGLVWVGGVDVDGGSPGEVVGQGEGFGAVAGGRNGLEREELPVGCGGGDGDRVHGLPPVAGVAAG